MSQPAPLLTLAREEDMRWSIAGYVLDGRIELAREVAQRLAVWRDLRMTSDEREASLDAWLEMRDER